MIAFAEQGTWTQADLARRLEIGVPALRKRLLELQEAGVPLDREDDPPHVYWSVPKGWFPGGVLIPGREVGELLRMLLHLPRSSGRVKLLRLLTPAVPVDARPAAESVVTSELPPDQERQLASVEEGISRREAVRLRYQSRTSAGPRWRVVSVHRVVAGSPIRLVVTCHESGELRWFRLDHVRDAARAQDAYRECASEKIEAFLRSSVSGYHGSGESQLEEFEVKEPEARWVAENLPEGARARWEGSTLRVSVETSAPLQIARFVVGLGAAGRALSPGLGEEVESLARGALGQGRTSEQSSPSGRGDGEGGADSVS